MKLFFLLKARQFRLWRRVEMMWNSNVSEDHAATIFRVKMEAAWHNPENQYLNVPGRGDLKSS
jgi:hypothetical protein